MYAATRKANTLLIAFLFLLTSSYSQPQFWGMTNTGGDNGVGVIFSCDSAGDHFSVHYHFNNTDGAKPLFTNFLQASDGLLYGMTYLGGNNNIGVLFRYNPVNDVYTKLFDFDSINGSKPLGSLMQASDGNIYGLVYKGGINDKGILFQYNPGTSVFSKKFDFGGLNGCYPHGTMVEAEDGKLYGLTVQGGSNDRGILFQYDPLSSAFVKKYDFDSINGSNPLGTLLLANDHQLYGHTVMGGIADNGVLFRYDLGTNSYAKQFDFTGINGNSPLGYLVQTADSSLYGMTNRGGALDMGVLFRFQPAATAYTKLLDFDSIHGSYPYGSLLLSNNNKLYGTTSMGGTTDQGAIFEYDLAASSFNLKHEFNGADGELPYGSLIPVDLSLAGIQEVETAGAAAHIFPNPSYGHFFIRAKHEGMYVLADPQGKIVLPKITLEKDAEKEIQLNSPQPGIYMLLEQKGKQSTLSKITILGK